MDNSKSKKILLIICAVIIGIFSICLIQSITILTSQSNVQTLNISSNISVTKGDYVKASVKSSTPVYCKFVHTFTRRLPIPLGTEYYYLIMSDDLSHCISIRANKDWTNQFQNGFATNKDGVQIEGYVKKISDDVQLKLNTVKSNYENKNLNIDVNPDLCIDLYAVKYAKQLLISSIVTLLVVAWFIFDYKKNGLLYAEKSAVGKTTTTIATCILFVAFIFIIISRKMLWGL